MAELYGKKKPTKIRGKEISSSNSLSFSSGLASLISSSTTKNTSKDKSKGSRFKENIFTAHKSKKRKIIEDENGQQHQTADQIGSLTSTELQKSKRRMEEKVRLYNAMKRGEYVPRDDGFDDRGLVDFDRKWAEKDNSESELSASDSDGEDEQIEYLDDLGRLRKGSKKEAEREARKARIQAVAEKDVQDFAARPQMPTNVIYGDAIQHEAFNPDRDIAQQMADLAKKRDKSATPPPATHFDAFAEVRTKGTGFYAFSHDAEGRQNEMEQLERTRQETERIRAETTKRHESKVTSRSTKSEADEFLDSLELPIDSTPAWPIKDTE